MCKSLPPSFPKAPTRSLLSDTLKRDPPPPPMEAELAAVHKAVLAVADAVAAQDGGTYAHAALVQAWRGGRCARQPFAVRGFGSAADRLAAVRHAAAQEPSAAGPESPVGRCGRPGAGVEASPDARIAGTGPFAALTLPVFAESAAGAPDAVLEVLVGGEVGDWEALVRAVRRAVHSAGLLTCGMPALDSPATPTTPAAESTATALGAIVAVLMRSSANLDLVQAWGTTMTAGVSFLTTRSLPFAFRGPAGAGVRQGSAVHAFRIGQPGAGLVGDAAITGRTEWSLSIDRAPPSACSLAPFARHAGAKAAFALAIRSPIEPDATYVLECVLHPSLEGRELNVEAVRAHDACLRAGFVTIGENGGSFAPEPADVAWVQRATLEERLQLEHAHLNADGMLDVSFETLEKLFVVPIKKAARRLGVSLTTLKRICRQRGIAKWPCRARPSKPRDGDIVTLETLAKAAMTPEAAPIDNTTPWTPPEVCSHVALVPGALSPTRALPSPMVGASSPQIAPIAHPVVCAGPAWELTPTTAAAHALQTPSSAHHAHLLQLMCDSDGFLGSP